VHAGDVGRADAERGQRGYVRGGMPGAAHDPDPVGLAGQDVAQHRTQFRPVVVGDDHVGARVGQLGEADATLTPAGEPADARSPSGSSSTGRYPTSLP
jgi:hypothetical protein